MYDPQNRKRNKIFLEILFSITYCLWVQNLFESLLQVLVYPKIIITSFFSPNVFLYSSWFSTGHLDFNSQMSVPVKKKSCGKVITIAKFSAPQIQKETKYSYIPSSVTYCLTNNKKPRGFMQSCFPMSVYFKCLREFLLYFYKCSTSMAFT